MRDRRYSFGALAPTPLLPLDLEELTDLVMGWVDVIVTLNADCLAQAFRAKGLDVEIAVPPEHGEMFLRATKRLGNWKITVQVSPQLREQMLNELMATANVVGAAKHLVDVLASREREEGRGEEHVVALANDRLDQPGAQSCPSETLPRHELGVESGRSREKLDRYWTVGGRTSPPPTNEERSRFQDLPQ